MARRWSPAIKIVPRTIQPLREARLMLSHVEGGDECGASRDEGSVGGMRRKRAVCERCGSGRATRGAKFMARGVLMLWAMEERWSVGCRGSSQRPSCLQEQARDGSEGRRLRDVGWSREY